MVIIGLPLIGLPLVPAIVAGIILAMLSSNIVGNYPCHCLSSMSIQLHLSQCSHSSSHCAGAGCLGTTSEAGPRALGSKACPSSGEDAASGAAHRHDTKPNRASFPPLSALPSRSKRLPISARTSSACAWVCLAPTARPLLHMFGRWRHRRSMLVLLLSSSLLSFSCLLPRGVPAPQGKYLDRSSDTAQRYHQSS